MTPAGWTVAPCRNALCPGARRIAAVTPLGEVEPATPQLVADVIGLQDPENYG